MAESQLKLLNSIYMNKNKELILVMKLFIILLIYHMEKIPNIFFLGRSGIQMPDFRNNTYV